MQTHDSDSEDELPPGWTERANRDGSLIYVNTDTGATTFEHPRTAKRKTVPKELPFGWVQEVENGCAVFVNVETGQRTATDPRLAFKIEESTNFRQRFDSHSTCWQILEGMNLTGKTILVTGGSCGIGWETAKSLAFHGASVIITSRNLVKTNEAIENLRKQRPSILMAAMYVDFCDLASVKTFAFEFRQQNNQLHVLILNAGVYGHPYELTKDGYETTFQVNHLSQFYLTKLLTSLLIKSSPSRVVVLSSESHRFSFLTSPDKLQAEILSPPNSLFFLPIVAYNDSKLLNVWFGMELDRRLCRQGVRCYAVHPGNMVNTEISRYWWFWRFLFWLVSPFTKTLPQGAATSVYAAVSPDIEGIGGIYLNNCCPCPSSKPSLNDNMAEKMWHVSEKMLKSVNMQ